MPQNCQRVTVQEVLSFIEAIDATGRKDGYPRNDGLPGSVELWEGAKLCELSEDEFLRLIIPQEPHILLRDKDLNSIEGDDSNLVVQRYTEKLENNETLSALIVRYKIVGQDMEQGSFYIEDGAHKALAYKKYFQSHDYFPVKIYIGNIEGNLIT